ncbi:hypothetical protein [Paraflavitalea speifideaquila]|nr:hypothetical protein [Paraflavitalea speifideiaquila]
MKKMFLAITASFLLVIIAGFTVHHTAAGKKRLKNQKTMVLSGSIAIGGM